jgi:hypothetical protein
MRDKRRPAAGIKDQGTADGSGQIEAIRPGDTTSQNKTSFTQLHHDA